jgi:hypothetical protein
VSFTWLVLGVRTRRTSLSSVLSAGIPRLVYTGEEQ